MMYSQIKNILLRKQQSIQTIVEVYEQHQDTETSCKMRKLEMLFQQIYAELSHETHTAQELQVIAPTPQDLLEWFVLQHYYHETF
ncbi:hypothetical protein [Staphylococcus pettenkoferi]|uniref:Uncharacterized protein n=1 Tax=Staphylococcus pettenkoferi TaxID=170573 RepID=A0A9Q4D6Y7_9STAP|nr:hypothetical protein [Staphylococcus pettenkoferi]MCY1569272.1 hypothetical protein [Staphylococcus pettenkoferi]MCY1576177.1 hypothetical protein [Staphylococcus pettenkoferi]MCY1593969.1 hypothetical protein [Staphylococcus pettenkoferi]MCY1617432.1 hypothetical protein [Staphylococcus pettenkoferi]